MRQRLSYCLRAREDSEKFSFDVVQGYLFHAASVPSYLL